jgi:predicted protein tyrosine phosphatase
MAVVCEDGVLAEWRLSICGISELDGFARAEVTSVVSILDPETPVPEAFARFSPGRDHLVMRFHDVVQDQPMMSSPRPGHIERLLEFGETNRSAAASAHLLIHCHAGISRSTAAAAILLCQNRPGREHEAFAAIAALRPQAWPNTRMIEIADRLLDRKGALLAALGRFRHDALGRAPWLGEIVRAAGRAHELPEPSAPTKS